MEFRFGDYLSAPLSLWRQYRWMCTTPNLPRSEMDGIVIEKLQRICRFAKDTVPYYRTVFAECGFDPEKLNSFEHWRKLPVLNKETVGENGERLSSSKAAQLGAVWCQTSGSTGTALRFLLDRNVNIASFALFWRTWNMAPGWHLGRRQAMISGYAQGLWEYQWKTRILSLSSFHLSEDNVSSFYSLIQKYRPRFLRGYPSALYLFAKLLGKKRLSLEFPMVFSGAETLMPFQREVIESTFGAKVIDHYTHWERCASICECERGSLHAQNDYGYHEILLPDGSPASLGEVGRLVCTGLYNHAMPLLRYDTMDLAVWSEETDCRCGSRFPIIERIDGRIEDVILTPEGRLVGRLDAAFKYCDGLRLAQIYQPDVSKIIVRLVVSQSYDSEREQRLSDELRKRLGNQISIEFDYVDDVPRTKRGKLRFVVSDIPADQKLGHS